MINEYALTCLDILSYEVWDLRSELSRVVDGTRGHLLGLDDTVSNGNAVIIFTESWGLVNNTGTVTVSDIGIGDDTESLVFELWNGGKLAG